MTTAEQTSTPETLSGQAPAEYSRWWLAPLVNTLGAVTFMAASLTVYHFFFAPRPVTFAVLDLHRIVDAKEIEFTAMLSQPNVSEADRKRAMDLVAGIEPQLKQVLNQVRSECGCEILVKAAAMTSGSIQDVTPRVAELMHINEQDVAKARDQLRRNLAAPAAK